MLLRKKIHLFLFVLSIWVGLLYVGCGKNETNTAQGHIGGKILDEASSLPVAGVNITLLPGDKATVSNNKGEFIFNDLAAQEYALSCEKAGYQKQLTRATVKENAVTDIVVILTPLEPVLAISPGIVDFGTGSDPVIINIRNAGAGLMKWSISSVATWIKLDRTSGATEDENKVVVSLNRSLITSGQAQDTLQVTSDGGNGQIIIKALSDKPFAQVSISNIQLNRSKRDAFFDIANVGITNFYYTMTSSQPWIIPFPPQGNISIGQTIKDCSVKLNTNLSIPEKISSETVTITYGDTIKIVIPIMVDWEKPNTSPTAKFTVTPLQAHQAAPFQVDASECTDAEDNIDNLEVCWRWHDGEAFTEWTKQKTANHVYESSGAKNITLKARDSKGAEASVIKSVTVVANQPPQIVLKLPQYIIPNELFTADVSGSTDDYDLLENLLVRWRWNSNEAFSGWSVNKTATHLYNPAGTYQLTVEIQDVLGAISSLTKTVQVAQIILPPDVQTINVSNIQRTSATVSGKINSIGAGMSDVSAYGHCWSDAITEPTLDNCGPNKTNLGTTNQLLSFSSSLTNLKVGTRYFVRSYAVNNAGVSYGNVVTFVTSGCIDIEGYEYPTVTIGRQTWMAENLRVSKNPQGVSIPSTIYNNDNNNLQLYGRMYDWNAASGNIAGVQGACPEGWHLPSEAEWKELIDSLGGTSIAGGKLKAIGTGYWASPNTGATNESKMDLRGGGMYLNGSQMMGLYGFYWTSSAVSNKGVLYALDNQSARINRVEYDKSFNLSVRCIKN